MKSAFLLSKDKQNNTWFLVDMEFLLSCSTRHLTIGGYMVTGNKDNLYQICIYHMYSFKGIYFIRYFSGCKDTTNISTRADCAFHINNTIHRVTISVFTTERDLPRFCFTRLTR